MNEVIGIDPGGSGGIALIADWADGSKLVEADKMPATDRDLLDWLNERVSDGTPCYVEKVSSSPQMGVVSAFKFGRSTGAIGMAVVAARCRLEYVTPQRWQKEFGLIVKGRGLGQDDTSKKNRNKARAQELFPEIKVTHAIADALLIAEYGRRQSSRPAAAT